MATCKHVRFQPFCNLCVIDDDASRAPANLEPVRFSQPTAKHSIQQLLQTNRCGHPPLKPYQQLLVVIFVYTFLSTKTLWLVVRFVYCLQKFLQQTFSFGGTPCGLISSGLALFNLHNQLKLCGLCPFASHSIVLRRLTISLLCPSAHSSNDDVVWEQEEIDGFIEPRQLLIAMIHNRQRNYLFPNCAKISLWRSKTNVFFKRAGRLWTFRNFVLFASYHLIIAIAF